MAHFVIAGKANDPDYARVFRLNNVLFRKRQAQITPLQAEMLAHHLHINMPDFHIQLIPKHPDEWDEYARQVFIQNGWAKRMARDRTIKSPERLGGQMIWRESGELIGLYL